MYKPMWNGILHKPVPTYRPKMYNINTMSITLHL